MTISFGKVTSQELEFSWLPQGISISPQPGNLDVTRNYDFSCNFVTKTNTPTFRIDFPNHIVTADRLSRWRLLFKQMQGSKYAFWLKNPFDYKASIRPYQSPYGSYTQGVLAKNNLLGSNRYYLYKCFTIPTSRGWKYFLKPIYRQGFVSAQMQYSGGQQNISLPNTVNSSPELADSYGFPNPSFIPSGAVEYTFAHWSGYPIDFQYYTLMRFDESASISYRPITVKGCTSYELQAFSIVEETLPITDLILAGGLPYANASAPASDEFSLTEILK